MAKGRGWAYTKAALYCLGPAIFVGAVIVAWAKAVKFDREIWTIVGIVCGFWLIDDLAGVARERGEFRTARVIWSGILGACLGGVLFYIAGMTVLESGLHVPHVTDYAAWFLIAGLLPGAIAMMTREDTEAPFFVRLHRALETIGTIHGAIWSLFWWLFFAGITAGAGWLIWWLWPSPTAEPIERITYWVIIGVVAFLGWTFGGSFVWEVARAKIATLAGVSKLGQASVHGTADIADKDEAAQAARGRQEQVGTQGLNLDY